MRGFSDCTWLTGEGNWRKRCNMKQVTVIVPIYNVEKYLRTCFESLKAQTSDEFVVMAVDDGSPDGCGRIIDEYTAANPGLITGIHKENGGYGSVLELAIRTCTTPYFMICDPDDTLEPNAVETLLNMARVSGADITIGAKTIFHENDPSTEYDPSYNTDFAALKKNTAYNRESEDFNDLFFIDPSPHAKLYRRSLAEGISFPEKVGYTDNLLFYISLLNSEKVIYTDEALANYLVNRTGNTMTDVSFKAMNGQILVFKSIVVQAERLKNVPDMYWYRMFESFKFMLYQTRRMNCDADQYEQTLDYLETFLKLLVPHGRQIAPLYRKYSKNGAIEKVRDEMMMGPATMHMGFVQIKKKLMKEFSER